MLIRKLILSAALVLSPVTVHAESGDDPSKLCQSAAELFKEGDIEGALEEARWCVTQLEQLKQNQTATFFKDEINGFKGQPISQQNAMGVSVVGREYISGDKRVSVALTGGAMNAFSALAQLGMTGGGSSKVRIQKRSATVMKEDGSVSVMVSLKSGGMLNFESESLSAEQLVNFAKKFPVKALDNSLME